jgi:hypothetical protein
MISQTSGDYPIGTGKILGLSPNAMGTSSDPTAKLATEAGAWGSTTWDKLDEVPMTSIGDYVRQVTADANVYLEVTYADTAETCINAVQGEVAYHSESTSVNNGKTNVYDGATERVVYAGIMSSLSVINRSVIVAPAAGTWDQTKVNGLTSRIGYAVDNAPMQYWDALMLEYNVDQ